MPTLRERFTAWLASLAAPSSFGVMDNRGEMYFIPADSLVVTKSGRLLFRRRGAICAAVAEGRWERVLKGITLNDMED